MKDDPETSNCAVAALDAPRTRLYVYVHFGHFDCMRGYSVAALLSPNARAPLMDCTASSLIRKFGYFWTARAFGVGPRKKSFVYMPPRAPDSRAQMVEFCVTFGQQLICIHETLRCNGKNSIQSK